MELHGCETNQISYVKNHYVKKNFRQMTKSFYLAQLDEKAFAVVSKKLRINKRG